MLKQVRCKKECGVWYYQKEIPNDYNELDGPLYELYDSNKRLVRVFAFYNDMMHFVRTGEDNE